MPRHRAAIGTHGLISLLGFVRDEEGRRVPAGEGQRATVWRAHTRFRDADGVSRRVERWARTKARAEHLLKAALAEREEPISGSTGLRGEMSMLEAGRIWLEQLEYADIRAKTRRQYGDEFTRYIETSQLQGMTLREVNSVIVIEHFLQSVADQRGNAAAKAARRLLSNLLNLGVRHRALAYSASRDVRQPRARRDSPSAARRAASRHDTKRAFTRAERDQLLRTADSHPDDAAEDVADLMAFLAGTGVRLSEALTAVWWPDVDLDAVDADGEPAPRVHVRGTKTDMADRVLPLPPWLADRLRRRKTGRWEVGLVFGSPRLKSKNTPRDLRNIGALLRPRFDAAGVPWASSHTFRRTVASWMDDDGAPLAEIANQLGHGDINVTATYLGRRQGPTRAARIL
jgi:integrase